MGPHVVEPGGDMSEKRQDKSISVKQRRVITAVVGAKSVEEGCRAAGISKQAFYMWRKDHNFEEEFVRQKDLLVDEALDALRSNVSKAVDTLTALLTTDNESLRRAVCNDVLGHVLKIRELQEVEARLTRLEQLLEDRQ